MATQGFQRKCSRRASCENSYGLVLQVPEYHFCQLHWPGKSLRAAQVQRDKKLFCIFQGVDNCRCSVAIFNQLHLVLYLEKKFCLIPYWLVLLGLTSDWLLVWRENRENLAYIVIKLYAPWGTTLRKEDEHFSCFPFGAYWVSTMFRVVSRGS